MEEFLKGINVHAPESRDYADELIQFLEGTPIEWVRIHPLPSRKLRFKNAQGNSYLDAIRKFSAAGFSLMIPIEVGIANNVGIVSEAQLGRFVDESYDHAYRAVATIERVLSKRRGRKSVIYGVENEIDTKEWILQSMPTVGWRKDTLAWIALSADRTLKFRRLQNILDGINDASPGSLTMTNFEADDPQEDKRAMMSFIVASQRVFSKLGVLEKGAAERMNNFRADVESANEKLDVDIMGLDNYPNYFSKLPPKGQFIGPKVDEITRMTGKPVMNVEFGYSAGGSTTTFFDSIRKEIFGARKGSNNLEPPPSPKEAQRIFFENALQSISKSKSRGTFPWVLFLDPSRAYRPYDTENGFTLLEQGYGKRLEASPALQYYLDWLSKKEDRYSSQSKDDSEEQREKAHVKTK
jgi:hypothetical protein